MKIYPKQMYITFPIPPDGADGWMLNGIMFPRAEVEQANDDAREFDRISRRVEASKAARRYLGSDCVIARTMWETETGIF